MSHQRIRISAELLLALCEQGTRFIAHDRAARCVSGVSANARLISIEANGSSITLTIDDPATPIGNQNAVAVWEIEQR